MNRYLPDIPGELRKARWMVRQFLPPRDYTCDTKNGRLTFSSQAGIVARRLYSRRHWSWDLLQKCKRLLYRHGLLLESKNDVLINAGAHIGSVLIPMMTECGFQQGLAFEPDQRNYHYLQLNVAQNDLGDRVQLLNCGLSSENRTAEFELSADNSGDHRVRASVADMTKRCKYDEPHRTVVTVKLRRLDDALDEMKLSTGSSSLLWVDVQGHEGQFFAGAVRTIESGVPVVAEFWPYGINRSGMSPEEYCQIVHRLFQGYFRHRRGRWQFHKAAALGELFREYSGTKSGIDLVFVPHSRALRSDALV